jgi:hypothetical protein
MNYLPIYFECKGNCFSHFCAKIKNFAMANVLNFTAFIFSLSVFL